jgi:hypothetical protein
MRLELLTKQYLSTMALTVMATGLLGVGAAAWDNPLKGRYLSGAQVPLTFATA